MGSFSIFSLLIILVILVPFGLIGFLPMVIKPSGPNRFGPSASPASFGGAIGKCFQKYVDFNGRASRSEYWWFYLFTVLIGLVALVISLIGVPGVRVLAWLALLLPTLAAGARRLHDINRSAWWLLLFLGGFGVIGLIVLLAWPSQKDDAASVF